MFKDKYFWHSHTIKLLRFKCFFNLFVMRKKIKIGIKNIIFILFLVHFYSILFLSFTKFSSGDWFSVFIFISFFLLFNIRMFISLLSPPLLCPTPGILTREVFMWYLQNILYIFLALRFLCTEHTPYPLISTHNRIDVSFASISLSRTLTHKH